MNDFTDHAPSFTDDEVLSALVDFGTRGFGEAADKWQSGKYGTDCATNYANYRRWKAMEKRARELIRELRGRS